MNKKMTRVIGIVAVLALIAVAFVGAGAADSSNDGTITLYLTNGQGATWDDSSIYINYEDGDNIYLNFDDTARSIWLQGTSNKATYIKNFDVNTMALQYKGHNEAEEQFLDWDLSYSTNVDITSYKDQGVDVRVVAKSNPTVRIYVGTNDNLTNGLCWVKDASTDVSYLSVDGTSATVTFDNTTKTLTLSSNSSSTIDSAYLATGSKGSYVKYSDDIVVKYIADKSNAPNVELPNGGLTNVTGDALYKFSPIYGNKTEVILGCESGYKWYKDPEHTQEMTKIGNEYCVVIDKTGNIGYKMGAENGCVIIDDIQYYYVKEDGDLPETITYMLSDYPCSTLPLKLPSAIEEATTKPCGTYGIYPEQATNEFRIYLYEGDGTSTAYPLTYYSNGIGTVNKYFTDFTDENYTNWAITSSGAQLSGQLRGATSNYLACLFNPTTSASSISSGSIRLDLTAYSGGPISLINGKEIKKVEVALVASNWGNGVTGDFNEMQKSGNYYNYSFASAPGNYGLQLRMFVGDSGKTVTFSKSSSATDKGSWSSESANSGTFTVNKSQFGFVYDTSTKKLTVNWVPDKDAQSTVNELSKFTISEATPDLTKYIVRLTLGTNSPVTIGTISDISTAGGKFSDIGATEQDSYTVTIAYADSDSVTLTYNPNGGSGVIQSTSYTGGEQTTVTAPTPAYTWDGHTLDGWNTSADGTGTTYTNGQSIILTGDTTLYAVWSGRGEQSGTTDVKMITDATFEFSIPSEVILSNTENGKVGAKVSITPAGDDGIKTTRNIVMKLATDALEGTLPGNDTGYSAYDTFDVTPNGKASSSRVAGKYADYKLNVYSDTDTSMSSYEKVVLGKNYTEGSGITGNNIVMSVNGNSGSKTEKILGFVTAVLPKYADTYSDTLTFTVGVENAGNTVITFDSSPAWKQGDETVTSVAVPVGSTASGVSVVTSTSPCTCSITINGTTYTSSVDNGTKIVYDGMDVTNGFAFDSDGTLTFQAST